MKLYLIHLHGEVLADLDDDYVYAFTNYKDAMIKYKELIMQNCERTSLDDSSHYITLYKAFLKKSTKKNMLLWALEFPHNWKIVDKRIELQEFENGGECKICHYCKTNTREHYSVFY